MSRFDAAYHRAHRIAERHPVGVLLLFATLILAASLGASSLRLDLSFRPLFASSPERAAPTLEFEEVFGQSSGAWVTAIVENRALASGEFIRGVADLSDAAAGVDGVSEVLSLTTARVPRWSRNELRFAEPIPEHLLDPQENEELEYQVQDLLAGSQFVDWLISEDGRYLLIAARLEPALHDLDGRRTIVDGFQETLSASASDGVRIHYSGVSVVEFAYEKQVLIDQSIATALATACLMILLFATLGDMRLVLVCLAPVTLAIPATLGAMGWLGYPVTIINTSIPAVILVIGAADAVHMLNAWLGSRAEGRDRVNSTRSMLNKTGRACFLTTITTMGGFLALTVAELESVSIFGIAAAVGIFMAWLGNQVVLPCCTRRIDARDSRIARRANQFADGMVSKLVRFAVFNPRRVLGASVLFVALCLATFPYLDINQRFNEELPEEHAIAYSQSLLEAEFTGFLGPEISIRRDDREAVILEQAQRDLSRFTDAIREIPDVQRVWSVRDIVPRNVPVDDWPRVLDALRAAPESSRLTRELINNRNNHLSVIVRLGDVGTARAEWLAAEIERIADESLGSGYKAEVVGQWWLAQQGMQLIVRDMLWSLATAMLIVGPMLWLALREHRLFIAAALANLLPLLLPLAFMTVAGISLRIGTAVVLAIALGIVVDNTVHIILRLRAAIAEFGEDPDRLDEMLRGTGRAIVFTTAALVAGFLSMMANDLLAIRDMGLVAAVTIAGAMIADLLFLPAIWVLMSKRRTEGSQIGAAAPSG